ncbi:MAG: phosphatase PAP2 family protein [Erysipelotrichaceae bacterium]|nr:phosphatase PAP2 family protein [Erysipelotrichaceae bacterium]
MNKERYEKMMQHFARHPEQVSALQFLDTLLTIGFVFSYIDLLLLHKESEKLIPLIAVPAVGLILITLLREWINKPRPAEVYGIPSALQKKKPGRSFPSRHVFSAFLIAFSCFYAGEASMGWLMGILSLVVALIRVCGGLHFVSDVLAGALCALAAALIGYGLIF